MDSAEKIQNNNKTGLFSEEAKRKAVLWYAVSYT